jgi:hypothetical protein
MGFHFNFEPLLSHVNSVSISLVFHSCYITWYFGRMTSYEVLQYTVFCHEF